MDGATITQCAVALGGQFHAIVDCRSLADLPYSDVIDLLYDEDSAPEDLQRLFAMCQVAGAVMCPLDDPEVANKLSFVLEPFDVCVPAGWDTGPTSAFAEAAALLRIHSVLAAYEYGNWETQPDPYPDLELLFEGLGPMISGFKLLSLLGKLEKLRTQPHSKPSKALLKNLPPEEMRDVVIAFLKSFVHDLTKALFQLPAMPKGPGKGKQAATRGRKGKQGGKSRRGTGRPKRAEASAAEEGAAAGSRFDGLRFSLRQLKAAFFEEYGHNEAKWDRLVARGLDSAGGEQGGADAQEEADDMMEHSDEPESPPSSTRKGKGKRKRAAVMDSPVSASDTEDEDDEGHQRAKALTRKVNELSDNVKDPLHDIVAKHKPKPKPTRPLVSKGRLNQARRGQTLTWDEDSEDDIVSRLPRVEFEKPADLSLVKSPQQGNKKKKATGNKKRKTERRKPTGRRKWTDEEVENLKTGVERFGVGEWAQILRAYTFDNRTNVNLKDKWRNIEKRANR